MPYEEDELYNPVDMAQIMRTFVISRVAYYDFLGLLYRYINAIRGRSQKRVIEEIVDMLKAAGYYVGANTLKVDYAAYKKLIKMGVPHKKLYAINPWVFRMIKKYADLVDDPKMVESMVARLKYDEPGAAMKILDREIKIEQAKRAGIIKSRRK